MSYSELSNRQASYVDAIIEHAPALGLNTSKVSFSRAELRQVSMAHKGKVWIPNWITHDMSRRVSRGVFDIPEVMDALPTPTGIAAAVVEGTTPVESEEVASVA